MAPDSVPCSWLVAHAALLPPGGRALDLACGRGRNALWLAARGHHVTGIDRDAGALQTLASAAIERRLEVSTVLLDLEQDGVTLPGRYDLIVVVRYLHRPLFPSLIEALLPGGVLVYETFTTKQAARGRPTTPAFLLEPGELTRLVGPLTILEAREGESDGGEVASVVAVKRG